LEEIFFSISVESAKMNELSYANVDVLWKYTLLSLVADSQRAVIKYLSRNIQALH